MEAQTLDPRFAIMLKGILDDEIGMAMVEAEESIRSRPEDLIERILLECVSYKRAGIRGQYEGLYRGHRFLIGWESKVDAPTMGELFVAGFANSRPPRRETRTLVFCIAAKPGGYPTDGLRFEAKTEGPLSTALNVLFAAAEELFERAEIERLMNVEQAPATVENDYYIG